MTFQIASYTRMTAEKRKLQAIEEPMDVEAKTALPTNFLPEVQKPIQKKAYLRVIDDSTPPDEQNVVIPYPVKDLS